MLTTRSRRRSTTLPSVLPPCSGSMLQHASNAGSVKQKEFICPPRGFGRDCSLKKTRRAWVYRGRRPVRVATLPSLPDVHGTPTRPPPPTPASPLPTSAGYVTIVPTREWLRFCGSLWLRFAGSFSCRHAVMHAMASLRWRSRRRTPFKRHVTHARRLCARFPWTLHTNRSSMPGPTRLFRNSRLYRAKRPGCQ